MPAREKRPRYTLPVTVNPENTVCVQINIPDEPMHVAAFWGAMMTLCHAYSWGNDAEHTAIAVADVWRPIIAQAWDEYEDNGGECATMFDCDDVAGCIENSEATRSALYDWLLETLRLHRGTGDDMDLIVSGGGGDTYLSQTFVELADDPIIELGVGCNNDQLFAFCRQLVQWLNRAIQDVLEQVEVATNGLEAVEIVIDEVPVGGQIAAFIDFFISSFTEAYLGQYTTDLENELACDLFCMAQANNCELTFRDVADYFADRITLTSEVNGLQDVIDFIISLTPIGDEWVNNGMALITQILAFGAEWAGASLNTVRAIWAAMSNDSDSDWVELCDECPPTGWAATWDFTTGQHDWIIRTPYNLGTYVAGVGWATTSGACLIILPTTTDAHVIEASVIGGSWTYGTQWYSGDWAVATFNQYSNALVEYPFTAAGGGHVATFDLDVPAGNGDVEFRLHFRTKQTGGTNGYGVIESVTVKGTGFAPQEVIDSATSFVYTN